MGTIASGIAHDFNNSLAAITGFAEVAKTSSANSNEFIEHILTATRQAAGTTKSLLTFSQESSGERAPRDMIRLVRETTNFIRKTMPSSIKLTDTLPEDASIWCSIDEVHIQQALVNLTINARDSLPGGGVTSISAGAHPDRPGFALLSISDNGTGMTPEVLKRIFDPFFTTKSRGQGTGLGMAIVHGVIEEHEGTIEIDSSVGRGTIVSIALPRCSPVETQSQPRDLVIDGRGESILVAEDNPEVQRMLVAQLKSVGFNVLTAEDGQQALRVLRQQKVKIRLVILDVDLPKKDGLTCLKEIGVEYPNLPAIVISGLSSFDPTQVVAPFLQKPFERQELLSAINRALRCSTAEQTNGVLVVDDDDAVRRSTQAVLVGSNMDVFLAENAAEAVDQLRKNIDRIGVILLDWHIQQSDPEAMVREFLKVSQTVRVLAVSGDRSLDSQQVQAAGFSRLLRKPVFARELVEAVTEAQRRDT
jgi:CheY-like chemotaxis protein